MFSTTVSGKALLCFIPKNDYNIQTNHYTVSQIGSLLKRNKNNPEVIQFLADLLNDSKFS